MSEPSNERYVVTVNGAPIPTEFLKWTGNAPIDVRWDGTTGGYSFSVRSRNWNLANEFSGHPLDLIEIAAAAFAADRRLPRGGRRDVHRDDWQREIALCIPVSDPELWSTDDNTARLIDCLDFVTGDRWQLRFSQRPHPNGQGVLIPRDNAELQNPDTVMLYSGGMDSLCAVAQALDEGRRPILVSQSAADHIYSQQRTLLEAIEAHFGNPRLPWLAFDIHGVGGDPASTSQRSRGFLFAALGMATAGKLGINDVRLADNGYISINPMISAQIMGSLASRGTHPKFMALVNQFGLGLFPDQVISNPLGSQTRAGALRRLDHAGHAELIELTRSCGKHRGRTNAIPHCGGCSQCVDRRFAVVAAGLEYLDPAERYEIEIFAGSIPEGEPRTVATSFLEFGRYTHSTSDETLLIDHPELLECIAPGSGDPGGEMREVIATLRDHAEDLIDAYDLAVTRHSRSIADGTAHPNSLIGLMSPTNPGPIQIGGSRVWSKVEAVESSQSEKGNQWHLRSRFWHVRFEGEKAIFKSAKGFLQIALLLDNEGQDLDIVALARGEALGNFSQDVPFESRLDGGSTFDERLDRLSLNDVRDRRREIEREIVNDRANERHAQVRTKSEAILVLDRYLKARSGKNGRLRPDKGVVEKARQALSVNVRRAYKEIDRELPDLQAHFSAWLHVGDPPHYHPEPPGGWDVKY